MPAALWQLPESIGLQSPSGRRHYAGKRNGVGACGHRTLTVCGARTPVAPIMKDQDREEPSKMNKLERVGAALRGDAVDRVPISFWGHDYMNEWTAEGLAEAMLTNYRTYDWDYMKVNPRASYHVEDWGARLERTTDPNRGHTFTHTPVGASADWHRLRP